MSKTIENVVALERQFWAEANNPEFFQRVFADDGITVMEPMGFVDKKTAVAMSKEGSAWKDVEILDQKTIQITPDSVAVVYHGRGTKEGSKEPYEATIASVYAKRDGDWQLVLTVHQPWDPKAD
jgi:hypothetical protein